MFVVGGGWSQGSIGRQGTRSGAKHHSASSLNFLACLGLACQTVIPNPLVSFGAAMGSAEPTSRRYHKAYVPLSAVPCMSCLYAEVALNFTP